MDIFRACPLQRAPIRRILKNKILFIKAKHIKSLPRGVSAIEQYEIQTYLPTGKGRRIVKIPRPFFLTSTAFVPTNAHSEIFGVAECEIIHFVNCEILLRLSQCEMKFAHVRVANISHLQSKYFTAKRFHLPVRANFVAHLLYSRCAVGEGFLFIS